MMKLNLSQLNIKSFLANYWQQKPIIIKAGIVDFENPLAPDELAGLAAESNIESRLIYQQKDSWKAESGPFESYEQYGDSHWSLVVQSVNHWIPAAQDFARLFDFIPQWRFDDVMVSFAAPHGGVGPHVDNYDVFICQGSGQRRWRIGARNDFEEFIAHEKLRHVKPFEAIIDEVLSAGDILYIPPGFPHEGISLDTSMSFSVGYKAVNATEVLSGFADYLIDFDKVPTLLSDKERPIGHYGQIGHDDVALLHNLLTETLKDKARLSDFLGIYYSQSRSELDIAANDYGYDEWLSLFKATPLQKLYAVKMLCLADSVDQGLLYVDGDKYQLNVPTDMVQHICDCATIRFHDVDDDNLLAWLWQTTNRGYWYFD